MATLAKGTVLKLDGTAIPGIRSITWSGISWAQEDTTAHDSSDKVTTTASTIASYGTIEITFAYDAGQATHAALLALAQSGAAEDFTIEFVTNEDYDFEGYVTSWAPATGVTEHHKVTATITVNGAFAPAA